MIMPVLVFSKTWLVGPGRTYTAPSQVSTLVTDGDSVLIDAGIYKRDVAIWRAHNLSLIGVGGMAHLDAEGTAYGRKAIWVIAGNHARVEHIAFSNCSVVDMNGAGIRQEGVGLIVRHCLFKDNQNGILAGDNPDSDIVIEHCEFDRNGAGDGYSHNIYINHVRSLVYQYNYAHHAYYGHEIKSRAHRNVICYNRITNEDGDASYEIDLPNGGPALVLGNVIQQSRFSDNNSIVSYGREGLNNPGPHNLFFVHNTVVNNEDRGIVLNVQSNADTVLSANNIFAGILTPLNGLPKTAIAKNNKAHPDIATFNFNNAAQYDYRLTLLSPVIDSAAILPYTFHGTSLIPELEYVHPAGFKNRMIIQLPDPGAYEWQNLTALKESEALKAGFRYRAGDRQLILEVEDGSGPWILTLVDAQGRCCGVIHSESSGIIQLPELAAGWYAFGAKGRNQLIRGAFVHF